MIPHISTRFFSGAGSVVGQFEIITYYRESAEPASSAGSVGVGQGALWGLDGEFKLTHYRRFGLRSGLAWTIV